MAEQLPGTDDDLFLASSDRNTDFSEDNYEGSFGNFEHERELRIAEDFWSNEGVDEGIEDAFSRRYRPVSRQLEHYFSQHDRYYVPDVLYGFEPGDVRRILAILDRNIEGRRAGVFGYSCEPDHIHIIHDCNYGNRRCRCAFREQLSREWRFKNPRRFVRYTGKLSEQQWYKIFEYYFLAKRGARKLRAQGLPVQVSCDNECIQSREAVSQRLQELGSEYDLQNREVPSKRRVVRRLFDEEGDERAEEGFHGKKSKKIGGYTLCKEKTFQLIDTYFPTPLVQVKFLPQFKDNDLLTNPNNQKYVDAAIQIYSNNLNDKSLRDFYNLLTSDDCQPIFRTGTFYASINESLEIINKLILYQFDDNYDAVCKFLETLVCIIDKKKPKLNTIVIHSAPSAGKNFFFDMITAVIPNFGQMGRLNRTNNFGMEDAYNKRIVMWNEPNYEASETENLKMLLGGTECPTKRKHLAQAATQRTPIIVLTNTIVNFMIEPAFKDRIVVYKWKAAPFLKEFLYQPYPLCFFELLNKYNIEF